MRVRLDDLVSRSGRANHVIHDPPYGEEIGRIPMLAVFLEERRPMTWQARNETATCAMERVLQCSDDIIKHCRSFASEVTIPDIENCRL